MNKPTFIEVCAGAGGLSRGLELAGMIPLLLNDSNVDCCSTLRTNADKTNESLIISHCSMESIDWAPYINAVDIVVGGIPCQSYSQAGKRKGLDDERGELVYEFAKIVKKCNQRCLWSRTFAVY